ncbi:hypothetical protein [Streptomyces sp. NPDC001536]|uniref:hypothetical protein n=1 Tax=Streptomyces sp. NPDC001536 TaxID=3364583 RepID=UPI0036CBD5EA
MNTETRAMARVRTRTWDGQRLAVADRVFRVPAVVVLAAGYLGLCSLLFPARAGVPELLRDAREGDVSVEQVVSSDVGEVRVFWSTGYLQDYEFIYHNKVSPLVRLDALGVLDLLVPVLYWRVMPYFAWPVAVCCVVALVGMVLRRDLRSPSAGYWLLASLVFGFGFPAYYWSEPGPLWSGRAASRGDRPALSGLRLAGATVCWAALGTVAVLTMALSRG